MKKVDFERCSLQMNQMVCLLCHMGAAGSDSCGKCSYFCSMTHIKYSTLKCTAIVFDKRKNQTPLELVQ